MRNERSFRSRLLPGAPIQRSASLQHERGTRYTRYGWDFSTTPHAMRPPASPVGSVW